MFLRYVLSKIEECSTASDVVKSVNILVAIRSVATAWGNVKEEVVKKCFRKAGILDSSFEVVTGLLMADDEDPFSEVDDQVKDNMQSLIERTMPADRQCSVEEYLMGDDDLTICTNLDCATWEDNFLSQLGDGDPAQQEEMDSEDNEVDNDEDNTDADVPNIQSFTEAIKSLEDVQEFLERRGHTEEAISVGLSVEWLLCKSSLHHKPLFMTIFKQYNTKTTYTVYKLCSFMYSIVFHC